MGKKRSRFSLKKRNIAANESNADVFKVQQYLVRFGYLGPVYKPRVLDEATQEALSNFQERAGLIRTGVIDPPTADKLEEPRCGFPDTRPGMIAAAIDEPPFEEGCKYEDTPSLFYAIINSSCTIDEGKARFAIQAAFFEWQRLIELDFIPVDPKANPRLTMGWFRDDHCDGFPFDGVGNVIAHAFPPPHCGDPHAGKCHFDDAEKWDDVLHDDSFDLQPVAIHEIGHLLGLGHIDQVAHITVRSVMNTYFAKCVREIPADDPAIPLIQQMYGARQRLWIEDRFVSSRKSKPIRKSRSRRRDSRRA